MSPVAASSQHSARTSRAQGLRGKSTSTCPVPQSQFEGAREFSFQSLNRFPPPPIPLLLPKPLTQQGNQHAHTLQGLLPSGGQSQPGLFPCTASLASASRRVITSQDCFQNSRCLDSPASARAHLLTAADAMFLPRRKQQSPAHHPRVEWQLPHRNSDHTGEVINTA